MKGEYKSFKSKVLDLCCSSIKSLLYFLINSFKEIIFAMIGLALFVILVRIFGTESDLSSKSGNASSWFVIFMISWSFYIVIVVTFWGLLINNAEKKKESNGKINDLFTWSLIEKFFSPITLVLGSVNSVLLLLAALQGTKVSWQFVASITTTIFWLSSSLLLIKILADSNYRIGSKDNKFKLFYLIKSPFKKNKSFLGFNIVMLGLFVIYDLDKLYDFDLNVPKITFSIICIFVAYYIIFSFLGHFIWQLVKQIYYSIKRKINVHLRNVRSRFPVLGKSRVANVNIDYDKAVEKFNPEEKLRVTNVNIDYETIKKLPIYNFVENPENKSFIFKLEIDKFFPSKAVKRKMVIKQVMYCGTYFNGEVVEYIDDSKEILLLLEFNLKQKINFQNLEITISYKSKERIYNEYYNLTIVFEAFANNIIPVQKYLYDHKKGWGFEVDDKKSNQNLSDLKKQVVSSCQTIYFYDKLTENFDLEEKIVDSRKVIAHVKSLGVGKSTYDISNIVEKSLIPIVISAWESNYDHDILYLIFDSIRKSTNTKKFVNDKKLLQWIFISTFVATVGLINTLLLGSSTSLPQKLSVLLLQFNSIADVFTDNPTTLTIMLAVILLIILYLVSSIIWNRAIPNFLIFQKNNTQVYKDFYIKNIVAMLEANNDYILLLEDIDRLDPITSNEVFRILSSINSTMPKAGFPYAIVSFSENLLSKKLDKLDTTYTELVNKVVYSKNWGKNYNAGKSMISFCNLNIEVVLDYLEVNEKIYDQEKNSENASLNVVEEQIMSNVDSLNFRDIVTIMQEVTNEVIIESDGGHTRASIVELYKDKIIKKATENNKLKLPESPMEINKQEGSD